MGNGNRYEVEARADKAQKFARWLIRNGYRPVVCQGWDDDQWRLAAGAAGVHAPSEMTKGLVIGLLIGYERVRR